MQKLIELLNEYNRDVLKCSDMWELKNSKDNPWTKYITLSSVWAWKIYLWIISKEYWFIKRLIENDKIDFNFVERVWSWDFIYDMDSPYYNRCTCEDLEEYNDVDRVLMLLAISDEPIDLLVSYLK